MRNRRDLLVLNCDNSGNLCIFFALLLAYFARSILAKVFFGNITLPIFYVLAYGSILIALRLRVRRMNSYLPWLLAIGAVILFGMFRTGDFSPLYGYLIVILLPLTVPDSAVLSKKWITFILTVTTFIAFGCVLALCFPALYRSIILPLFKENDYRMIMFVLNEGGGGQGGFLSQSGYASYFLCIGIGALYCFKAFFKSKPTIFFLAVLFIIGLLITQKRSPLVMFILAILFVYYIDGRGSERFKRIFYIILALLGFYFILSVLVSLGFHIAVLEKVYDVLHGLISGTEINDTGRTQLYGQATLFFLQNPIFGIGWANYKNLFVLRKTHVHDIYLQLLCETGIIGFTVFMAFFITNVIRTSKLIRSYSDNQNSLVYSWLNYSLYIQSFFLLFGITENPLYDTEDVMLYFFAVGISFAIRSSVKTSRNENVL